MLPSVVCECGNLLLTVIRSLRLHQLGSVALFFLIFPECFTITSCAFHSQVPPSHRRMVGAWEGLKDQVQGSSGKETLRAESSSPVVCFRITAASTCCKCKQLWEETGTIAVGTEMECFNGFVVQLIYCCASAACRFGSCGSSSSPPPENVWVHSFQIVWFWNARAHEVQTVSFSVG